MIIKVLIDNNAYKGYLCEWGLSLYIEFRSRKILLDAGTSGNFIKNAEKLGINMKDIDFCILSHAHYDHADGMQSFFQQNADAKLFIRHGAGEDCYSKKSGIYTYIGIKHGFLQTFSNRIEFVSDNYELFPGAWLIPHKSSELPSIGQKAGMYRYQNNHWIADAFSHEQSLVLKTESGLAVFNSCSHSGAAVIIEDMKTVFPEEKIYALIGGFHLFQSSKDEVLEFARQIECSDIRRIITGHCTGDEAFSILKGKLGSRVEQFESGYSINL